MAELLEERFELIERVRSRQSHDTTVRRPPIGLVPAARAGDTAIGPWTRLGRRSSSVLEELLKGVVPGRVRRGSAVLGGIRCNWFSGSFLPLSAPNSPKNRVPPFDAAIRAGSVSESGTDPAQIRIPPRWAGSARPLAAGVTVGSVQVDLLFDPFGGRWEDLRDAAVVAEEAGFDGVWLYDHLAGSVHRAPHVLECWTVLSALAVAVPHLMIGSLVLNVANRDAGTLAVMAATLQEVSGGRLLLGVGAGGGAGTPYAAEQVALGRPVPGDAARRAAVESTIATLRQVWSGTAGGVGGFLRPSLPPPVIVGGFGPKMAELAGRLGDGINAPVGILALPPARHRPERPRRSRSRPGHVPGHDIGIPNR